MTAGGVNGKWASQGAKNRPVMLHWHLPETLFHYILPLFLPQPQAPDQTAHFLIHLDQVLAQVLGAAVNRGLV
jgi:hypothetical protein